MSEKTKKTAGKPLPSPPATDQPAAAPAAAERPIGQDPPSPTGTEKHEIRDLLAEGYEGKGYILYLESAKHPIGRLISVAKMKPTLKIRASGETFRLREPAFFLNRPVWIILRGWPVSLSMEFAGKDGFRESPIEPSVLNAAVESTVWENVFSARVISTTGSIILILSNLLSIALTWGLMKR